MVHTLKVCMVTPYYPPSVGGIERFVSRLTENLRRRGISVSVITGTHFGATIQGDGVIQIPTRLTIMGNPLMPGLTRALREGDYDLVHAHDEHAFTSNTVAYAKPKINRPFVMHCHGSYTGGSPLWKLFVYVYMKTLGSYTLSNSDVNIALSPSEAEILARFGAKNIRVIPNAVDPSELDTRADPSLFRSRYGIGDNRKLVLFVGRLIKVKGVHLLPKIARLLGSMGDDVCFAVVGDGPMGEKLKHSTKGLGVGNMVVTGRVPREELSSAYAAADVVLTPSLSEGIPAVVLEALMFRKPVVATRLPTLTDYFEQVCKFVDPGDIHGYAEAVRETLNNPPQDAWLTEAERLVLEQFNWGRITDQIVNVYRQVTEQPSISVSA